jgi:hypothetical protein
MEGPATTRVRAVGGSIPRVLAVLTLLACGHVPVTEAQDLRGLMEIRWDRSEQETEREGAPSTGLELSTFRQRYRLDFVWQLYPNLTFSVGGLFERDKTMDEGSSSLGDSTRRRWNPYVSLRQRSRIFFADLNVNRLQDTSDTFAVRAEETRDDYSAVFGWRPEPYPTLSFRLQRTDHYDASRQELDIRRDIAELRLQYEALDRVSFNYRAGEDTSENRVEGNEIRRNYHSGNVSYGDMYWNRRVQFSAEYDFDRQRTELTTSGTGEIATPVPPVEGLSELTDFPETVTLSPNPGLIDENRTASAGINLGLPPPGGDERPRNMGLDLGGPTTLNNLRVWVATELPLAISNSFVWDVYTSSDNLEWTHRETVAPATFGTLEPVFDLRLTALTARYVKVVTRPLDPTVPGADQFPDIFVTELEAFLWRPASDIDDSFSATTQRFTTDLRTKLLPDTDFYYEFSYTARDTEDRPLIWSMSNGLSYRERLHPVFTLSARAARVDEDDLDERLTAYIYSASLRAVAIPTLTHNLVFSGRWNEVSGGSDYTNSVFLYNGMKIYRGVTTNLGLGNSATRRPDGMRIINQQINATANLVPHRTFSVNLQHLYTEEDRRGGPFPEHRETDRGISSVSVAYTPLPAVYLFASYRRESSSEAKDLSTRNYSLSWNPFAGGSLQLNFRYNETYRTELDTLYRLFTSRARWNITNRWFAEIAWEQSRATSDLARTDTDILRAATRLVF